MLHSSSSHLAVIDHVVVIVIVIVIMSSSSESDVGMPALLAELLCQHCATTPVGHHLVLITFGYVIVTYWYVF